MYQSSKMLRIVLIVASFVCIQGLFNGNQGNIWDFPYQTAILRSHWGTPVFHHYCSGVIISNKYILTTASCAGDSINDVKVRVGSSYHNTGGLVYSVQDIYKHFNFTPDFDSDIALLKLSDTLMFSRRVSTVKLPTQSEVLSDATNYKLSAWGYSSSTSNEGTSNILQTSARATIMSAASCKAMYNKFSPNKALVTDNMLCANLYNNNQYNPGCERDQGGPLVTNGTVYGLFSWNYECGNKDYSSVFTKVSAFRNWMDSIIQKM